MKIKKQIIINRQYLEIPPGVLQGIVSGINTLAELNLQTTNLFVTVKNIMAQVYQIYGSNSASTGILKTKSFNQVFIN